MRTILIMLALAAVASGCGGGESADESTTRVVAAFYPVAFAAERVADADAVVTNLTPPGAEPHDVELSARDVARIGEADLVLYLGKDFQPALERAIGSTNANAIDLLAGLSLRTGALESDHEDEPAEEADPEHAVDPHVWLDPVRYAAVVERIAEAVGRSSAARPLVADLDRLHAEYEEALRECERRELVTSHAAFGYLADRYGLEQIAITGLSPEAEPTPGELHDVVEEVREHGATTIFFETLVSPRLAQAVAREVRARTAVLNPLEGLTAAELDRGEDYFSIMRANLAALQQALGCS